MGDGFLFRDVLLVGIGELPEGGSGAVRMNSEAFTT
jgi:hypothetical protein